MSNWKTYRNGNYTTLINLEDGTRIRETEEDEFIPNFAENQDIKITNRCSMGCKFCHEGSTSNGKHGDILNEKFIDTLHPYQECAIGGGNILEHPDLIPFLRKLKERKVIANITLHQCHFEHEIETVDMMISEKLIYGLGISLINPTEEFISKVKKYPNAVIHVINGILKQSDVDKLSDKGLKILILGYKCLRRGNDYYDDNNSKIKENQKWLKENISDILNHFKVVSFDNLAIEQLDIKQLLTDEEWEEFYAGEEGSSTFYIDMVERKFAQNSTAPFDKRYDLLDSVDDMFNIIRSENKLLKNI